MIFTMLPIFITLPEFLSIKLCFFLFCFHFVHLLLTLSPYASVRKNILCMNEWIANKNVFKLYRFVVCIHIIFTLCSIHSRCYTPHDVEIVKNSHKMSTTDCVTLNDLNKFWIFFSYICFHFCYRRDKNMKIINILRKENPSF